MCDYWEVFKVIKSLEDKSSTLFQQRDSVQLYDLDCLVSETIFILKSWANSWAGEARWQSLLNKSSLLHEIEESLVSISELLKWVDSVTLSNVNSNENNIATTHQADKNIENNTGLRRKNKEIIVFDLCCGKGIFSMLLSFLAARPSLEHRLDLIKKIFMVDKVTTDQINWDHITECNKVNEDSSDHQPSRTTEIKSSKLAPSAINISCFGGCNIHDDSFYTLLEAEQSKDDGYSLALIGIHTCKTLSTRFAGIHNLLGKDKAPFLCLAPCCLPRTKYKNSHLIPVSLFISKEQRERNKEQVELRKAARIRYSSKICYICYASHRVRDCPTLKNLNEDEQKSLLHQASLKTPCWRCGLVGMFLFQSTFYFLLFYYIFLC